VPTVRFATPAVLSVTASCTYSFSFGDSAKAGHASQPVGSRPSARATPPRSLHEVSTAQASRALDRRHRDVVELYPAGVFDDLGGGHILDPAVGDTNPFDGRAFEAKDVEETRGRFRRDVFNDDAPGSGREVTARALSIMEGEMSEPTAR